MALIHHIEKLRAKPEHIRERIAFGTAAGVTGVAATIWVIALAATGTFSLSPSAGTLASGPAGQGAIAQTQDGFSQLVGAVGAAAGSTNTAPSLRIVDDGTTSSLDTKHAAVANNSNATVIPF
ncbi:MAG: hypothetical protein JWL88_482 [Parcubacteria group bacterium]|nr:hypothetical protein [Parcubacteria group bacterium]